MTKMDKEYLKKHNLLESVKRFQQIFEYVDASGSYNLREAGEEDDPNAAMGPDAGMGGNMQDPNMGGGMPGPDAGMGGEMPQDPNAAMGPDAGMDGGMPQDPNAAMGADGGEVAAPEGFAPQVPQDQAMGADPMAMPEDMDAEDEEVIDVDDLTDAQEETEDKIDKLTSKFEKLLDKIDNFENQIDASNEKMETLKAEIEKRNPTPVEKLSLRSKDGYPFNVTPEEYWKEKEATSDYSTEDDNNGADDRVYQITKDEIDNFNDYGNISRTFDDYDLRTMFGY